MREKEIQERLISRGPPAPLERDVERYLVERVRAAHGMALKWVSPANAGVCDRICLLPRGRVVFVELKRPGGKVRPLQERMIGLMRQLGADVRVLDSKAEVDRFVAEFR